AWRPSNRSKLSPRPISWRSTTARPPSNAPSPSTSAWNGSRRKTAWPRPGWRRYRFLGPRWRDAGARPPAGEWRRRDPPVARVLRKRLQWRRQRRRTHGDGQRSTGPARGRPAANISPATAGAGRRFAVAARRGRGVPRDDDPAACPNRPRRPRFLRDCAHKAWAERRAREKRARDIARRRAARLSKARVSASTASDAVHRRARRTGTARGVDYVLLRGCRRDVLVS